MATKANNNNGLSGKSQAISRIHSSVSKGSQAGAGVLIGASEGSHFPTLLDPQVGSRIDGATYGEILSSPA
ncbi:MAG: hypothetical protein V2I66_10315, partial [Halieaceae bacterium]|nr:hypothetical protein [Halieaceae bacterium]